MFAMAHTGGLHVVNDPIEQVVLRYSNKKHFVGIEDEGQIQASRKYEFVTLIPPQKLEKQKKLTRVPRHGKN